MLYFIILIVLALGLTFIALKTQVLLFRLGGAMAWLVCGIYLLTSGKSELLMSYTWNQVLGFLFIVMAIAVLSLQMITEVRRESAGGVFTSWERKGSLKKSTLSSFSQEDYRKQVRGVVGRGIAKKRSR